MLQTGISQLPSSLHDECPRTLVLGLAIFALVATSATPDIASFEAALWLIGAGCAGVGGTWLFQRLFAPQTANIYGDEVLSWEAGTAIRAFRTGEPDFALLGTFVALSEDKQTLTMELGSGTRIKLHSGSYLFARPDAPHPFRAHYGQFGPLTLLRALWQTATRLGSLHGFLRWYSSRIGFYGLSFALIFAAEHIETTVSFLFMAFGYLCLGLTCADGIITTLKALERFDDYLDRIFEDRHEDKTTIQQIIDGLWFLTLTAFTLEAWVFFVFGRELFPVIFANL